MDLVEMSFLPTRGIHDIRNNLQNIGPSANPSDNYGSYHCSQTISRRPTATARARFLASKYGRSNISSKRLRRRLSNELAEYDEPNVKVAHWIELDQKAAYSRKKVSLSPFEALPAEILQLIATFAISDQDIRSLVCTSSRFAATIYPDESTVWRHRFLSEYDFPFVKNALEFASAYKLRRFVLTNFVGFDRMEDRNEVQLHVIKDMVLETYNKHGRDMKYSDKSRNLVAISVPRLSPWMLTFLSSPFASHTTTKSGLSDTLFDMLQVTMSHLLLSPKSAFAGITPISRNNYDIARVYNFNHPHMNVFADLTGHLFPQRDLNSSVPKNSSRRSQTSFSRYRFDIHSILHIRNFFARHLIDDPATFEERTYAAMATELAKLGKAPQQWERPLYESTKISSEWTGHYSCIHPWPKNRQDLEEGQSCAEEWDTVEPMAIHLELAKENSEESFWPSAFDSIPALALPLPNSVPVQELNITFFRGIAPFVNLTDKTSTNNKRASGQADKHHPFKAIRVRGYTHDMPISCLDVSGGRSKYTSQRLEDRTVPGWKRVVMIFYRPTTQHLLQVLEYAEEEYGGAYQTELTNAFNTASIWNTGGNTNPENLQSSVTATELTSNEAYGTALDTHPVDTPQPTQIQEPESNYEPSMASTMDSDASEETPTSTEIEAQLQSILDRRIETFATNYNHNNNHVPVSSTTPRHPLFSAAHISHLDSLFIHPQHLSFDRDTNSGAIDIAYAYEGTIIPGGKIMMGRWWKVDGLQGLGQGREVNEDGVGVEVRFKRSTDNPEDSDSEETASSAPSQNAWDRDVECFTQVNGTGEVVRDASGGSMRLERGPFCFWAC